MARSRCARSGASIRLREYSISPVNTDSTCSPGRGAGAPDRFDLAREVVLDIGQVQAVLHAVEPELLPHDLRPLLGARPALDGEAIVHSEGQLHDGSLRACEARASRNQE